MVAPGTPITGEDYNKLGSAFNDRLRAIGDLSWRIFFYAFSLFRNVRNPSGALTPAYGEWHDFFQYIDPKTGGEWPTVGPGLPEGANLANPMMAFHFGNPNLTSEESRTSVVDVHPENTMAERWVLGAQQRGVYDPVTGEQNLPAFEAAQSHFRIVQGPFSPFGRAYGGYVPVPEIIGDCGDAGEFEAPTPLYSLFFTPVREGLPVKTYTGVCPIASPYAQANPTSVIGISEMPLAYYIFLANGAVERLSRKDYIKGPYTFGGQLAKTEGGQLNRALNAFAKDFRGTDFERAQKDYRIRKTGFDFQKFLTSHYFLAPNIGHMSGSDLIADYPTFTMGPAAFLAGGTQTATHTYADGFCLCGVYLQAEGLMQTARVRVLSGTTIIGDLFLVPNEDGFAEVMRWFPLGPVPNPLRFELLDDTNFTSAAGKIVCQATEQLAYKPEIHDAYLLLRIAATVDAELSSLEGSGIDFTTPRKISQDYFTNGCIRNHQGASGLPLAGDTVTQNPVYDAARRFFKLHSRAVNRRQLIGYAVENGKSVLWFKRFPEGFPDLDPFEDIAGDFEPAPSDGILEGETYIVRGGGHVIYDGTDYEEGERFVGVAGLPTYQTEGAALPYVYDGIRAAALPKGSSNEWTMFDQLKVYSLSESSIFKVDAFADVLALSNRCHFYSTIMTPELRRHFGYGDTQMLSPEAPPGFNYVGTSNRFRSSSAEERESFYRSCQVYQPDEEIESATSSLEAGVEVVKLVFKARFQHCTEAPSDIPRSTSGWDIAALGAEPYRTRENGIREYLIHQSTGLASQCSRKIGDTGAESPLHSNFGNVFGACYPWFIFTHLIPLKFEDDNATAEPEHDSRGVSDDMQQIDFYLQAICEAFVDGATSRSYGCATGVSSLFDYTYENLCFEAFGGRWTSFLPVALRDDKPQGFGVLPATSFAYAELFNQLSSAVNLLDKLRIDLPFTFQYKLTDFYNTNPVTLTNLRGTVCATGGLSVAYGDGLTAAAASTVLYDGPWSDLGEFETSITAVKSGELTGCPHAMVSYQRITDFRIRIDPLYRLAIPEPIAELVDLDNGGVLCRQITETGRFTRSIAASSDDADKCPSVGSAMWFDGPDFYHWDFTAETVEDCVLRTTGRLEAPATPPSDYKIGRDGTMPTGAFCTNVAYGHLGLRLLTDSKMFVQIPLRE